MKKQYLMALDAGGGSGRCLLAGVESGAVHTARRDWTHPPAPNTNGLGYDLDLPEIWRRMCEASREALDMAGTEPGEVLAVAATSMRNTTVLLDAEDNVLLGTPNSDARAAFEALTLGAEQGKAVHEIGGHWPGPLFTGSRLLWLRTNAPDMLERAKKVLSLSDWVGFRMGGGIFAERSQAGETLLFDLRTRDWAHGLIQSLGFTGGLFPETIDAGTVIGALSKDAASDLGLLPGTPVVAGGGDTQCALLGSGAVEVGDLCVIAGTTMPVEMVTGSPVLDEEGRLWSGLHVIPGLYVLESNGLTTGSVLEWFAKIIYPDHDDPVRVLFGEAERSEPGGAGVYSSFGASVFDARSISIPVGNLTMSHMVTCDCDAGRRHISRALIEGIAYSARANIEQILAVSGSELKEIKVAGGMTRSALWTQVLSDVTDKPVKVPLTCEVSALGAAVCAGAGAGVYPDLVSGAKAVACAASERTPDEHAQRYQALFAGWKDTHELRADADRHVSGLVTMAMLERAPQAEADAGVAFRPKILVTASMDEEALGELKALGEVRYEPWREKMKIYDGGRELVDILEDSQVFITEMDIVDFEAIRGLPTLKAIVSCRVNPVNVDVESATAFGIPVVNTPGRNADAVADLVVAMMIMLARKLADAARFLKDEKVEAGDLAKMGEAYAKFQGAELWRKTVGIVGLGSVGKRVALRVKACGARVVFFDPAVTAEDGALSNAEKVSLDGLLSRSDFVTVHAPATDQTRHMIDREAFSSMKPGAFFINTARASLVDDVALAEALESGRLAGAALDVFSVEPPASDDPIVSRDNVIATPHLGGNTLELAAHQGAIAADQLGKLLNGETPEHVLNPEVMARFGWTEPRREPPGSELERLAGRPRPSVTS